MMNAEKLKGMIEVLSYDYDIKSRMDVADIIYNLMNSLPEGYENLRNALDELYRDINTMPTEDIFL